MPGEWFSREYSGNPFILFGTGHLAALGLILLICGLSVLFRARWTEKARMVTRIGLCVLIYLCEGSWQIWMWAIGSWSVQGMLPLWLCSITSWTIPILLILRNRRYFEWVYFMGLIGASMALLTPDLMQYGFPHFRFLEYFTVHGAIIIAVVYMAAVEGYRPYRSSILKAVIITDVYWAFCGVVNRWLGSNYLYTQGKLPTPSVLDVLGPHPYYLIWMELIGICLCLLLYLPYEIRDRSRQ